MATSLNVWGVRERLLIVQDDCPVTGVQVTVGSPTLVTVASVIGVSPTVWGAKVMDPVVGTRLMVADVPDAVWLIEVDADS